tara:strand:+ start:314 stop:706 length:393 start_codon:yes stop_codon:yes gene_type:complete
MGLIKVGTKGLSKVGRAGKLAKRELLEKSQQTKEYKVHAQGVVQTGTKTVGFSVQSQPGKRAQISFGYMNKGFGRRVVQDGTPYTNQMAALPLPTGKELAVAGGLVGSAYGLGYLQEQADKRKKSGKRSK